MEFSPPTSTVRTLRTPGAVPGKHFCQFIQGSVLILYISYVLSVAAPHFKAIIITLLHPGTTSADVLEATKDKSIKTKQPNVKHRQNKQSPVLSSELFVSNNQRLSTKDYQLS